MHEMKIISYEAPHYAVFSNLLSLHFSSVQIFSTPSIYLTIKFHGLIWLVLAPSYPYSHKAIKKRPLLRFLSGSKGSILRDHLL
jgi:hypothetical protein